MKGYSDNQSSLFFALFLNLSSSIPSRNYIGKVEGSFTKQNSKIV